MNPSDHIQLSIISLVKSTFCGKDIHEIFYLHYPKYNTVFGFVLDQNNILSKTLKLNQIISSNSHPTFIRFSIRNRAIFFRLLLSCQNTFYLFMHA